MGFLIYAIFHFPRTLLFYYCKASLFQEFKEMETRFSFHKFNFKK